MVSSVAPPFQTVYWPDLDEAAAELGFAFLFWRATPPPGAKMQPAGPPVFLGLHHKRLSRLHTRLFWFAPSLCGCTWPMAGGRRGAVRQSRPRVSAEFGSYPWYAA